MRSRSFVVGQVNDVLNEYEDDGSDDDDLDDDEDDDSGVDAVLKVYRKSKG